MMYCLCSKKISSHVIYLFINVCGLCVGVTYCGKDPLINAFMVWMDRVHLYCSNGTYSVMPQYFEAMLKYTNLF